jgi:subtilisin family serine protease
LGGPEETGVRLRGLGKSLSELTRLVDRVEPAPRIELPQAAADPSLGVSANDPQGSGCGTQWYLHEIGLPQLWEEWQGLWPAEYKPPVVAVVDGGVRDHPELHGVLDAGRAWNSCDETAGLDAEDPHVYHGTAVVGLLASQRDGAGMVGVAPGLKVWPIQATCKNRVPGDPWAKAVVWAHEGGARVILVEAAAGTQDLEQANMFVEQAVKDAVRDGVVVILPAGNGGTNTTPGSSARSPDTGSIVVGATTFGTKDLSPTTNFGKRVVVCAPGDAEYDLTVGHREGQPGYVRRFGGTSGAAAKVAGVVALMLAVHDGLTPDAVREILGSQQRRALTGRDGDSSGRYLDAHSAVKEAMSRRPGG